jgi:ABC-type glycerol-3-phosphate transport system substrate-binding protein
MPKITAAVSAGTPPNLIVYRPNDAAALYDLGAVINMEPELRSLPAWQKARPQIPASFLEALTWRQAMVGQPFQIAQQSIGVATNHLNIAGLRLPTATWTWNDFLEILKRAARPPDVWGMDVPWKASGWTLFAGSNGARFLNKELTKVTYTQPESIAAVEFMVQLTHGLGLIPRDHPQDGTGELMHKNQTVTTPLSVGRIPVYRQAGVPFEVLPWPRGPHKPTEFNEGSLWTLIVFKVADKVKQSASVMAAAGCLSDEAQTVACSANQNVPVVRSAKESASFRQMVAQEPAWKAFADIFASCLLRPSVPSYAEMEAVRDQMLAKIYKQQESIRTALTQAEQETQRLLDADLARNR